MAELSTIARPYAEALFEAVIGPSSRAATLAVLDELATVTSTPAVAAVTADPQLDDAQVYDLIAGLVPTPLAPVTANFVRLVIANQRLDALPAVATQFRALTNAAAGVADLKIESAFPLTDGQVADLVAGLSKKFGVALEPSVVVDRSLIGGVRVAVGDHVLDTSVRARLAQMQSALTA